MVVKVGERSNRRKIFFSVLCHFILICLEFILSPTRVLQETKGFPSIEDSLKFFGTMRLTKTAVKPEPPMR